MGKVKDSIDKGLMLGAGEHRLTESSDIVLFFARTLVDRNFKMLIKIPMTQSQFFWELERVATNSVTANFQTYL